MYLQKEAFWIKSRNIILFSSTKKTHLREIRGMMEKAYQENLRGAPFNIPPTRTRKPND